MDKKLLAEYQPMTAAKYYYASNQLNSTRLITDRSGSVVYSAVFDPYGGMQKEWVNTYNPSLKFSGKEREANTEMDYFGARYYGHKQYRFISVDPVINKDEALANPQLWNLYAYCRNNPVTFFDPDGRDEISIQEGKLFANVMSTWNGTPYAHLGQNAVKGASGGGDCSGISWAGLKEAGIGVPYFLSENNERVYFTTAEFHNWVDNGYFIQVNEPQTGDIGRREGHMLVFDSRLNDDNDSWSTHQVANDGLFGQADSSGFGGTFIWYRRTTQFTLNFSEFSLSHQNDN